MIPDTQIMLLGPSYIPVQKEEEEIGMVEMSSPSNPPCKFNGNRPNEDDRGRHDKNDSIEQLEQLKREVSKHARLLEQLKKGSGIVTEKDEKSLKSSSGEKEGSGHEAQSNKQAFRENFRKYANRVINGTHGLSHVKGSQNPLERFFWLVWLLFFAAVVVYAIKDFVEGYLKYEVIAMKSEVQKNQLKLPAVYICNVHEGAKNNFSQKTCRLNKLSKKQSCKMKETVSLDRTNCLVLNMNGTLHQSYSGWQGRTYVRLVRNTSMHGRTTLYGIYDQGVDGAYLTTLNRKYFKFGNKYTLVLKRQDFSRLPSPYTSRCASDYAKKDIIKGAYTQVGCQALCHQSHANDDLAECNYPLPCTETKFDIQIKSEPLKIHPNWMMLHVYYDQLSYSLTEETPRRTLISIVAKIGGFCGLFLGLKIVSVFEALICVVLKLLSLCWRSRDNN